MMGKTKTTHVEYRAGIRDRYRDVFTGPAVAALEALAPLNRDRLAVMTARTTRRAARARDRSRIEFLDPEARIGRTQIRVGDAREGKFAGGEIPEDLERQW